jgi:hypothetical protein
MEVVGGEEMSHADARALFVSNERRSKKVENKTEETHAEYVNGDIQLVGGCIM